MTSHAQPRVRRWGNQLSQADIDITHNPLGPHSDFGFNYNHQLNDQGNYQTQSAWLPPQPSPPHAHHHVASSSTSSTLAASHYSSWAPHQHSQGIHGSWSPQGLDYGLGAADQDQSFWQPLPSGQALPEPVIAHPPPPSPTPPASSPLLGLTHQTDESRAQALPVPSVNPSVFDNTLHHQNLTSLSRSSHKIFDDISQHTTLLPTDADVDSMVDVSCRAVASQQIDETLQAWVLDKLENEKDYYRTRLEPILMTISGSMVAAAKTFTYIKYGLSFDYTTAVNGTHVAERALHANHLVQNDTFLSGTLHVNGDSITITFANPAIIALVGYSLHDSEHQFHRYIGDDLNFKPLLAMSATLCLWMLQEHIKVYVSQFSVLPAHIGLIMLTLFHCWRVCPQWS
ncbi:hypothetical protein C8R48DRAFT_778914 [Suillus tomentosus]|nr:hypothetical protein C8R48DRAFT_778914 [Suillus tomentosus]